MKKAVLYYIYDPMCSWCWGYRPTWQVLQQQLQSVLDIQYRVGGLAADSELPMPDEMREFIQQTWHKIAHQLGSQFNFDFWTQNQPRRSTYPACRAVLIARAQGLEQQMYLAIQQAYYLQAKNPSNTDTLIELAESLDLRDTFAQQLHSDEINRQLSAEMTAVRQMPIQGFPSLVLRVDEQLLAIPVDYQHWQKSYDLIMAHLRSPGG